MRLEHLLQTSLPVEEPCSRRSDSGAADPAFTANRGQLIHRWVPWVAGYSAEFVRQAIGELYYMCPRKGTLLDPFAGVGTTLVEGTFAGIDSVGFEINPFAALVCRAKLSAFDTDPDALHEDIVTFAATCAAEPPGKAYPDLRPPGFRSRVPFSARVWRQR